MNEILKTPSISDFDKWQLYSQALQRYLNQVKFTSQKFDHNSSPPQKDNNCISTVEESFRNPCNNSFNFSPHSMDISGVYPIRDSLNSISQPVVRNFFEKARESNGHILPTASLPLPSDGAALPQVYKKKFIPKKFRLNVNNVTSRKPQSRSRIFAKKRRAETTLSSDMSQVRPCKVSLNEFNWDPTNAR